MIKILITNLLFLTSLFSSTYIFEPKKISQGLWCVFADLMPPTKENKGFVSNVCWVENGDSLTLLDAGPTALFAKELEIVIAQIKKSQP